MMVCESCHKAEVSIRFGEAQMCLDCYNGEMAKELGVQAESYPETVSIRDGEGEPHVFHLKKRLDQEGIFMEAVEKGTGHCAFEIEGDLHGNQGELLLELFAKIERGLAERFVLAGELVSDRLAGTIAYDKDREEIPFVVVDGKTYKWEEIGQMLARFEGFQLKLEMVDPLDEIRWEED